MLKIANLNVSINDRINSSSNNSSNNTKILNDINLTINPGEVHAIMGPNGSGKSTFSRALIGDETYQVDSGSIQLDGQDITEEPVEVRAQQGLFLSFQYPVELPGVSNIQFLKTALNHTRQALGQEPLDAIDILEQATEALKSVGLDESFLKRGVNDGFSGGEKKRNELVQLLMLKPKVAILDEIDSGLDVDALKIVAKCIEQLKQSGTAFILITHYKRLLESVAPDHVHLLKDGAIQQSGGMSLAETIEAEGYQTEPA